MRLRAACALLLVIPLRAAIADSAPLPQAIRPGEDILFTSGDIGNPGGRLVASLRSDPKTLNPITAVDLPSKELISLLFADLIHINLSTQRTEATLAKSWRVSADGKHYTVALRHGI